METRRQRRRRNRNIQKPDIRIGEFDIAIFGLLATYRYLTAEHISLLLGKNGKGYATDRLLLLFENGYIKQYYDERLPLAWPNVFVIDEPAIEVLLNNDWQEHQIITRYRREAGLRSPNFSHDFAACNVIASLQIRAQQKGVEFLTWRDILDHNKRRLFDKLGFEISYTFPNGSRVHEKDNLMPDGNGPFGFVLPNGKAKIFGLELETGANPVEPTIDLKRPSTLKKALAYQYIVKQKEHTKKWGVKTLRILFVTGREVRLNSMLLTTENVIGPTNQFLFTHAPIFKHSPLLSLFDRQWKLAGMDPTTLIPTKNDPV